MKKLLTLLCSFFLITLSSFGATVYHVASISAIMYGINQGNGAIKMTPISSHSLLTTVSATSHLPISDYVVAVQEIDGHTAGKKYTF